MKKQNKNSNGVKIEINNRTEETIDLKSIKKVISAFGRAYKIYPVKSPLKRGAKQFNGVKKNKEISVALVGDGEIKKLNFTYRCLNQATDILSFSGEDDFLGELVINYRQIKRQAAEFKHSARQELIFVLTHGLLHLIGYDDKTEAGRKRMIKLGEEFIKKLKM